MKKLSKLTQELALALEVASLAQAWGNPSPFQNKINELLVKAGRKPVAHLTPLAPDGATCASPECGGDMEASLTCKVCGVTRPAGKA